MYRYITVWKNRESFDGWRASTANAKAHSKVGLYKLNPVDP